MAYCKTDAIALKKVDYSDTSQIVTFYTRDFGKLQAIAKGSKRQTKKSLDALDILTHYEIVFTRKQPGTLQTLTEWTVRTRFPALASDLSRMYAAMYAAELVMELTEEAEPSAELFGLLVATLRHVAEKTDVTRGVFAFELKALRIVGYLPEVTRCVSCGSAVAGHRRLGFSPKLGGTVCDRCRESAEAPMSLSGGSLAAMSTLAKANGRSADRLRLSPQMTAEIRAALKAHITFVLGKEMRMWKYL